MCFGIRLLFLLLSGPATSSDLRVIGSDSLSLHTIEILETRGLGAAIDSLKQIAPTIAPTIAHTTSSPGSTQNETIRLADRRL